MKKLLIIAMLTLLTGCSTTATTVYKTAMTNFVYEPDIADERRIYNTVDKTFHGDCEDFAFTLQKQIGGEVWYVVLNDKTKFSAHAVLVKDGVTYDYIYKSSWKEDYPARFMWVMVD